MFAAKSGIVWHLAAYQYLVQDQATQSWFQETDVHCQILEEQSVQNANLVVALVYSSLARFKETHPWVTDIEIRMDNAGKYYVIYA